MMDERLNQEKIIANAPSAFYEKCIHDLRDTMQEGYKPRRIVYDFSMENRGFLFNNTNYAIPVNVDSLKGVMQLRKIIGTLYGKGIPTTGMTEEMKQEEQEYRNQTMYKTFTAMEKVIPNFEKYRRWVLRTYNPEELTYLSQHGVQIGDLTLNNNEQEEFANIVNTIVDNSIEKIDSGNFKYGQITAYEIPLAIRDWSLASAWTYHPANPEYLSSDIANTNKSLDTHFISTLNQRLLAMADGKYSIVRAQKEARKSNLHLVK